MGKSTSLLVLTKATLESSAIHQTTRAKYIPYQPLLIIPHIQLTLYLPTKKITDFFKTSLLVFLMHALDFGIFVAELG